MVQATLTFGVSVPAHGDVKIPVWGDLFHSLDSASGESSLSTMRIRNLRDYIKTLQAK